MEELAGSTTFRRGEAYFSAGAVGRIRATGDRISARVEGSDIYQAKLWDDDGELENDCTCPHAADGNFCKHCVALGLTWLSSRNPKLKTKGKSGKTTQNDPWKDIQGYLTALPPIALIEILLEVAERDDPLYRALLLQAHTSTVAARGGGLTKTFRRAIDEATEIRGSIDWREVPTFARNIDQMADSLGELLKPDTAGALVELVEYAIESAEDALEQVDDSNGEVADIVHRLGELHHKACMMAKPDPIALAERLFRFETSLPFVLCSFDAATYRDALGAKGLHRYRDLAEAEWRKIKPRTSDQSYDSRQATITRIMERLAEMDGNIEELVAIKSRDLSSPHYYLNIAEILLKAGQPDKALEWAERGLKAFSKNPGNPLRDFLVAAYLKHKRNDEALQLTWIQFEQSCSLETYKKLHDVAQTLGIWPMQRERALTTLADSVAREAAATSQWKPKPSIPDQSVRVSIALWENSRSTKAFSPLNRPDRA